MRFTIFALLFSVSFGTYAQKYKSVESKVRFFSEATLENIAADNTDGSSVFDESTGDIVFSIPIKSFEFQKSLMQEHFNENYMESDKYPKSIFKGKVIGFEKKGGLQNVSAEGELTIHGVTKEVKIDGTMNLKDNQIKLNSVFIVKLEDYNVKIPQVLWQNIAEEVEVTLNFIYQPL